MSDRVRIVSKGWCGSTDILVDGVPLENVTAATWHLDCAKSRQATVTLRLIDVPVEVEGELAAAEDGIELERWP